MRKKIIAVLIILLLLEGFAFGLLSLLVSKENIKKEITGSFKALTGMDLEIQGEVVLKQFPVPHVLINSLYVPNVPEGNAPFLITVKLIDIYPSIKSLLKGKLAIGRIQLDGAEVNVESFKNGKFNWKNVSSQPPLPSGAKTDSALASTSFNFVNAGLHYRNNDTGSTSEIRNVSFGILRSEANGNDFTFFGNYKNKPINLYGNIGDISKIISSETVPVNIHLKNGNTLFSYEGTAGFKDSNPNLNGTLKLETDDINSLLNIWSPTADNSVKPSSGYKAFPLKMGGEVTSSNKGLSLPHLILDGNGAIKGNLQVAINPSYHADIKGVVDSFDLDNLLASGVLKRIGNDTTQDKGQNTDIAKGSSFFNSLSMTMDIAIADILENNQHIKDSHLNLDMAEGEMTIPQASALLPGESRVIFSGIGKDSYQGFILEGQLDAAGNDFNEMLSVFKNKGFAIPPEDFKRFRLKANTVLSSHDLRLSEIAARIENIGIVGGLINTFGERDTFEAALHVSGINLDHFVTLWSLSGWQAALLSDASAPQKEAFLSHWLKQLNYTLKVNALLDHYVLNNKMQEAAEFKLNVTNGKLALNDIKTSYEGSKLSGSFGINLSQALPHFDIDIITDTLDMNTFFDPNVFINLMPSPTTPDERWSHKEFNFYVLDTLTANYHFKCDHLKNGAFTADTFDVAGSLNNRTLNVDSFSALMFDARVAAKATIRGGKIPAVNLAVDMFSLPSDRINALIPALQGMIGKYNISTRLATSGIDMYSWVANLEGTFGFSGSNVMVHGFNLSGIVHAVAYVRTVADILDVVKRAFPGGDTLFSSVQGQCGLAGGSLKIPNAKLVNDDADGIFTGEVDLINWKIKGKTIFTLKSLTKENPPLLSVIFSGDFDAPEKSLDTRSLEKYVTNKTSQKILEQYAPH
jgi:uncharacterized protein involved in outer membrane biogenesis